MTTLALILLLLGEIALWLDLGNRLFGSYVRTPRGAAARISLIVAVLLLLALPTIWLWIDSSSRPAAIAFYSSALVACVVLVHFLFPYRWGIRRPTSQPVSSKRTLAKGLLLTNSVLEIPELPKTADGLSCLLLSDLHCNSQRQLEVIRDAIHALQDNPVDLVFLLGDFGENKSILPQLVIELTKLAPRLGTFCVLGNHDQERGRQELLVRLLQERSVHVLVNEYYDLPHCEMSLLGLAFPPGRCELPSPRYPFLVGLTHSPDNLLFLDRVHAAVAFAGHTHGGKISFPGIGAVVVPSKLGRFFDEGWFQRGNTLMYLTRGIGYFAGRFGNVGEICRFTLKRR
jgi:predicted MPP superfamily phosphohydrolase